MNIILIDKANPESIAMLQALYSRSTDSAAVHLDKVTDLSSSAFMEKYYVGYGHSSIGDCGTTYLFLEDVSLLAAKAVQDNPLYSGQETSTRYVDFTSAGCVNPYEDTVIQSSLIAFVNENTDRVLAHLKAKNPESSDAALKARTFDILRGFLPAGIKTKLSWATNLRQLRDNLDRLATHPLNEVRALAETVRATAKENYPSSFSSEHPIPDWAFASKILTHYPLEVNLDCTIPSNCNEEDDIRCLSSPVIPYAAMECISELLNRPKGSMFPRDFAKYGLFRFTFLLDFASFRDLQRHRNGICPIPYLSRHGDIGTWYIESLPPEVRVSWFALRSKLEPHYEALDRIPQSKYESQYYVPIGTLVQCEVAYSLPELIYILELRTSETVHPTLRRLALILADWLELIYPQITLHLDTADLEPASNKRGLQTITTK